jgi:predicted  nucleic acid-binding Zn-ribbon protein
MDKTTKAKYRLKHVGLFENFDLSEATAKITSKEEVDVEKTARINREFVNQIKQLAALSEEYKALDNIIKVFEDKAKKIQVLKEQILPVLQKYNAQFLRIEDLVVEVNKKEKLKGERITYSYKEISEALESLIPVTEQSKKAIEDIKELNKKINPAEKLISWDVTATRVQEGLGSWIKDVFGKLADTFSKIWDRLTGNTEELESNIDELSTKLKPIGIRVPSTSEVMKKK